MHRHELDRRDAEILEVLDDRGVRHAGVGAAHLLRDIGVRHRRALDVGLVDDGIVVGDFRRAVVGPVEEGVDDDRGHRVAEAVFLVASGARVLGVDVVGEERGVTVEFSVVGAGVGIDQQLVRVAALARAWVVRAVDAVSVTLSRLDGGEVAVPDVGVDLFHVDALLVAGFVDQAEFHFFRHVGEEGEVGACAVIRGSEGVGLARPDLTGVLVSCRHGTRV